MKSTFFVLISIFLLSSILGQTAEAQAKKVYVTAASAKLKAEAKAGAADVGAITRGTELTVKTEQGPWLEVTDGKASGWISKLFISPTKPIGQAELLKDSKVTDEQMSRKRASGYSVSAATRGLSATSRNRNEKFRSNNKALEELEAKSVNDQVIEGFQTEAKGEPGK